MFAKTFPCLEPRLLFVSLLDELLFTPVAIEIKNTGNRCRLTREQRATVTVGKIPGHKTVAIFICVIQRW